MVDRNNLFIKNALKLYFISGTNNVNKPLPEVLSEAISGGITLFQFREKGDASLTGRSKREMALKLKQICQANQIPFIINDDVELALEIGADGVHVGQTDANGPFVREKIGDNKILGISAHTIAEAKQAVKDGADYIGVGPMYPTNSKADAEEACGPEMISAMREEGITIPIVAIGGIDIHRTRGIAQAGADGVSVISAIASATSAKHAAEQFRLELEDL
ncbi:thiamine phosphate synthase [Salipaludibacillus sp. HK11]|uniref:thiamine phosphate synthase n=1 Tax=Salipaludibacillus sp. HK11 TaxID=3394320 RepID=UPI0039FC4538